MRTNRNKLYLSMVLLLIVGVLVVVSGFKTIDKKVSEVKEKVCSHEDRIIYIYITPEAKEGEPEPEVAPIAEIKKEQKKTVKEKQPVKSTRSPKKKSTMEFEITAYDNSVESQGKWVNQTATGFNLKGHSRSSAKCIAVDPRVIPLGSKVQLYFGEGYKHFDGVYIARDTGGAIKGNRIDLFMGDGNVKKEVRSFGRRKVQAKIIK